MNKQETINKILQLIAKEYKKDTSYILELYSKTNSLDYVIYILDFEVVRGFKKKAL